MRLTRVHCTAELAEGNRLALPEGAGQHLVRVLRLQVGAPLRVFDGRGAEHDAVIRTIGRREVEIEVGRRLAADRESPLHTTLLLGVSRGERMDLALQKATELGVTRIRPVLARRSSVRLDARDQERRRLHWQGVLVAACEQSGRTRLPELLPALDVAGACAAAETASLRVLLAAEATQSLAACVAAAAPATDITLLVGPEGGLDESEEAAALQSGFRPCLLGPRVLRTETAPLAALAVLQVLAGDFAGGGT